MSTDSTATEKSIEAGGSVREPWRHACPWGHRNWRSSARGDYRYTCGTCGARFDHLLDLKHERPRRDAPKGGEVA